MQNSDIKNLIINIVKADGKKIPPIIIVKKAIDIQPYLSKNKIYDVINQMIANNELKQFPDNKVVLGYINAEPDLSVIYESTISINSHYDGFVNIQDENKVITEEFYVNKINTKGALKGDLVKFALLKKDVGPQSLREAKVLEIVKREKKFFVAEIVLGDDYYEIIPDDSKIYLQIDISNIDLVKESGEKVLLAINSYDETTLYTSIQKIIGNKASLGVDVESIVYENNVPIEFDDEVLVASEALEFKITDKDKALRKDIRNRKIITIDPATSKDLDDAVYVERMDNGNFFLSVSIADVSSYVTPDSVLDKSAFLRGTSVYLINKVIPMLPFNISDNLCSLNENEDKMSLTCDMEINKDGDIISYDVYPSIMRNHCRFSYDQVNKIFNQQTIDKQVDEEILASLKIARELHHILRNKKHQQGYIEFDIKEPLVKLDENGVPVEITVKESGEAQRMIEDFMVACNEAVTLFANKHEIPFVYRIHERPEMKKINNFLIEAKKLNFYANVDYLALTPKDLLTILDKNKDNENFLLLNTLLLRVMQKAKYSVSNIGHFGLALQNYTHFTSPIRRYADLIVHRLFWMYLFDKESYSDKQRLEVKEQLEEICTQCNAAEIRQVDTERSVYDMKFAEYMSYHIGEIYQGKVDAVTSYGLFVELDNLIEGLVAIKNIPNDYYIYNPETLVIIGRNSHRIFSLGTSVKIQVLSANKHDRKIDFKIIE